MHVCSLLVSLLLLLSKLHLWSLFLNFYRDVPIGLISPWRKRSLLELQHLCCSSRHDSGIVQTPTGDHRDLSYRSYLPLNCTSVGVVQFNGSFHSLFLVCVVFTETGLESSCLVPFYTATCSSLFT